MVVQKSIMTKSNAVQSRQANTLHVEEGLSYQFEVFSSHCYACVKSDEPCTMLHAEL